MGCEEEVAKKRETPERRNSLEKTIRKSVQKRKY